MTNEPTRIAGEGAELCAPPSTEAHQEPPHAPSDPFLDPWRTCRSEAAQRLLGSLLKTLDELEQTTSPRKRARRPDDQVRWQEMVEAVVSALALETLSSGGGAVAIPLSHRQDLPRRYRRPTQGERLGHLLDLLAASRLAHVKKGTKVGAATTIEPAPLIADLVSVLGLRGEDFGRREARELLVLRLSKRVGRRRVRQLLDYAESSETARLRTEVRLHNMHLALADISYAGNSARPDLGDRQLRRHFTTFERTGITFDRGGRYFGGFWQKLKKEDRRHIRINGEPVVEVDYSAAFAHMAFARVGTSPPAGADLYAIPGLEGLCRRQVKAAFNTFLFDTSKRRQNWPEDYGELDWTDAETGEVAVGMPPEYKPSDVRTAILNHYPALSPVMCAGVGHQLMYVESEMMRRCLTELHRQGLTGLPLHDALVVPRSEALRVQTIMEEVSLQVLGLKVPAKITPTTPHSILH